MEAAYTPGSSPNPAWRQYQCCPNRCLTICSSTVVTLTQVVPLVLFTVQFFLSHVRAIHSTSHFLSGLRFMFLVPHQSAVYIPSATTFFLFKVFFRRGYTLKLATKNLVGHGHGQGSDPFRFFVLMNFCSFLLSSYSGFPIPCFFLGTFP